MRLDPSWSNAAGTQRTQISSWAQVWRKQSVSTKVGAVIVLALVVVAVLAPVVAPHDPNQLNFVSPLRPPSLQHPMGTDESGRDVLSRCLYALRLDLFVVLVVTYAPLPVGVVLGAIAGYHGGMIDSVISRFIDVLLSIPFLVLVVAVIAVIGPGLTGFFVAVPVISWALYARIARSAMLGIREMPFMQAGLALGFSNTRVIFRHGIPNIIRTSLVYSTVDLMANLLLLAGLSYIGLGVRPPQPELGAIIADGQPFLLDAWWVATMPGLVLVTIGIGVALLGEGLNDGELTGARQ
ncbi:putative D,D-dipeptide transport system permease protein DdpC [Mycolicibacterium vanbaalenii]|uniref:Putative D,D-dipeptide transport system permease protein DdpC n=1 Tax=Mycolicibacterium vanbaalenii TaxID=110539 RepID=A0A5S9QDB5_MYCVN|nr:ABC transporter permease [Mycolicibacterium vanbaalenii]CAA0115870.1 putative D,D-dipeptide transport system permease protein DdpC [Mycolicibacterium vanbaalenii]